MSQFISNVLVGNIVMKKTFNHCFLHPDLRINAFDALQILDNRAWVGVIISPKVM